MAVETTSYHEYLVICTSCVIKLLLLLTGAGLRLAQDRIAFGHLSDACDIQADKQIQFLKDAGMRLGQKLATACVMTLMMLATPHAAQANITVADYLSLRQQAHNGDEIARAQWRFYIVGLMDGIQAVQAPTEASGGKVFFCMPEGLPVSPKFLDDFIQSALQRMSDTDQLTEHITSPMAVLVAIELRRAFPCE